MLLASSGDAVPTNLAVALVIAVSALSSVVAYLFKLFVDNIKVSHASEMAVLREYLTREQARGDRLEQTVNEQTAQMHTESATLYQALDTVERFYTLLGGPQQQQRRGGDERPGR